MALPVEKYRSIPAVEKVAHSLERQPLPHPVKVAVIRGELNALRKNSAIPEYDCIVARIRKKLDLLHNTRIQPLINGTGILANTNLGRAPLGRAVLNALSEIGSGYNNLEFDLETGKRGKRGAYLENNLALLCRAEAAMVTNNCAAALVLILRHFTSGKKKEVIISRGELIQIGGGFRIPEILESSGAVLREVGTTNKTSTQDYAEAIGKKTALLLKVHRSNFFMEGFVQSPSLREISALAKKKRLPFVEDLGSGALYATEKFASLEHEPTPGEVLREGADCVAFSGDKLLGGPQVGIIAGKRKWIAALKREPFFRALRCDKLILIALQTTIDLYLKGTADTFIPLLSRLMESEENLRRRGEKIMAGLEKLPLEVSLEAAKAGIGGGALPRAAIKSIALYFIPEEIPLTQFAAMLRSSTPPIVGYISEGRFVIDLRTVGEEQDDTLLRLLRELF